MIEFFYPTKVRIILFIIFVFIAFAGQIQTYDFASDKQRGVEKPMFYDLLSPFPFWPIWVLLISPLIALSSLLNFIGGDAVSTIGWGGLVFWIMQAIYFYCLASFIGWLFKLRKSKMSQKDNKKYLQK